MACRIFTGFLNADGYGQLRHNGKVRLAHRVAYCQHHNLPIESIDGQVVRHTCDTPACWEPEHLELGTVQDNVDDRMNRGRHNTVTLRGESNGNHTLTDAQVAEVRARYKRYCRVNGGPALAAEFGVTQSTISKIVRHSIR